MALHREFEAWKTAVKLTGKPALDCSTCFAGLGVLRIGNGVRGSDGVWFMAGKQGKDNGNGSTHGNNCPSVHLNLGLGEACQGGGGAGSERVNEWGNTSHLHLHLQSISMSMAWRIRLVKSVRYYQ
jgi:hypothetical protein